MSDFDLKNSKDGSASGLIFDKKYDLIKDLRFLGLIFCLAALQVGNSYIKEFRYFQDFKTPPWQVNPVLTTG